MSDPLLVKTIQSIAHSVSRTQISKTVLGENRNHDAGSKGLTLVSKRSLSRRNMICAAMVESIVLDCLLTTRPKRDHTRSEGAEVCGIDRNRRARRARRGNSGSSTFHWTSGCDCGAYHGRNGAAGLNQCASSHCTPRSSLTSFLSSTCMAPSMSIACADAAAAAAGARSRSCLLFLCGCSSCMSGGGWLCPSPADGVAGEGIANSWAGSAAGAGCFISFCNSSFSCCRSSNFASTLPLSGTKTGSMQSFGKNCGTYWRKRVFTRFHWSAVSFTARCTRHLKAKQEKWRRNERERAWIAYHRQKAGAI